MAYSILWLLPLFLATIIAITLFGDNPQLRGTWIQRIHCFIHRANGQMFHLATKWLDSHPVVLLVARWLVPAFYTVLMTSVVWFFFAYVHPNLPPRLIHSSLHRIAVIAILSSLVGSTVAATVSDPGTVTPKNAHAACQVFQPNGLIFFEKDCPTCQLPKPARSKHCSECNRCVMLFDHHCLWINNCVGLRNYRWFLAYLLLNAALILYGSFLCFYCLRYSRDLSPKYALFSYWHLVKRSSFANEVAGVLLVLGVCLAPLVLAFFALHIRYLYLGVTTNESDKWGDINYLVDVNALYHVPQLSCYVERAHSNGQPVYLHLSTETILFADLDAKSLGYTLIPVVSVENDLTNIYDAGFLQNIVDRVFGLPF